MKNRCPIYLLLLLAFCLSSISNAQSLYPVTASLRMSGPSSSRFFTFSQPGMIAGRPNRIALDLRLNDLDEPSLDVRLKWDISGSDISFSSSDISATNIVSLVSGQFVRLDNAALSSYFQPSAFDGLSDDFLLRSDGLLPEGMYEICVTAYELTQGKQVSNTSCQIIFLEELEPPLIVTPVDEVLPTYPQNVILNWQANHLAVFPVQYTIALWEEIEGLSPDQITFQTPPLYTETVLNRTAFVFNASHPLLTPGRNYLVQVRARDNDDAYVFKNNGFSPVHRFHYGAQEDEGICEAPGASEFGFGYGNLLVLAWNGGDLASALASADAKAEGTASPSASGLTTRASTTSVLSLSDEFGETTKKAGGFYRIRYRILGTEEWSSVDTDQLTAGIKGLRAGKTYEVEISKVCASGIVPSPIFQVTVPKLPRRLPQECGSEPSTEGFEETPIDELFVNDTIIAAGAYVRITNVVGGPAGWTGEGEVAMPFLPKSRVAVEFSNIVVNVNYELIAGYIETVYDDKMSNVVNLDAISGLFDNGPSIEQVNYAIPIDTIMQGPGGIIIVVRSDGGIDSFKAPIIVIAPGLEAVLVNGYQFEVFDLDNMVDSIAPEQFTFMAHPEQKYGFDGVKKELFTEYKEEAGFVMPYKSVAFGEADKIKAVLTGDPPNDADVHFVELSTAADLTFTRTGNEYDIVTGGLKSGLSQVIALGPNGIMGMFQVMGTAKEFVTVHLVPLNGYGKNTDAQSIEKAATDILRQAGFSVRVDVLDVGLQYDGAKISLENHFASAYSPDMKQIISQLGSKVNKEAHDVYMILTDKMEGNTAGFMPKGMGIGFMELGGGGQTLAHELCHGLFNMPHIFEGFYEGKTKGSLPDNLMDYNDGTALYYRQWARMQSPGVHLAWFDDEREGKQLSAGNLDYQCLNGNALSKLMQSGLSFMDFGGNAVQLKSDEQPYAFVSPSEGAIYEGRIGIIRKGTQIYGPGINFIDGGGKKTPEWTGIYSNFNFSKDTIRLDKSTTGATKVIIDKYGNLSAGELILYEATEKCPIVAADSSKILTDVALINDLDVFIILTNGQKVPENEEKDIYQFIAYVKSLLSGQTAFFVEYNFEERRYAEHPQDRAFWEYLRDKNLATQESFDKVFRSYTRPGKDFESIVSNVDLWADVPDEYNANSFDYTSYNFEQPEDTDQWVDFFTNCKNLAEENEIELTYGEQIKRFLDNPNDSDLNKLLNLREQGVVTLANLGGYDLFKYTIKDLIYRKYHLSNKMLVYVKEMEANGQAVPITESGNYEQQLSKWATDKPLELVVSYFMEAFIFAGPGSLVRLPVRNIRISRFKSFEYKLRMAINRAKKSKVFAEVEEYSEDLLTEEGLKISLKNSVENGGHAIIKMENGEFNDIHFDGPTTIPGKYQGDLDAELAIAQAPEMVDKMAALKMLKEEKIYVAQPGPTPTYENVKDLKYSLSSTVSYSLNGKSNPELILLKLPQGQRELIYCSQGVLEELIKEKSKESNCEICPDRKPTRSEVVCKELQQLLKSTGNKSAVEKLCKSKLNDIDLSGIIQKLNSIPARRTQFLIDLEKSCSSIYSICYNIDKLSIGLIEAWSLTFDARGTNNYKLDIALLDQIVSMKSLGNSQMYNTLGGDAVLIDIMAKNKKAPCNTCQNNEPAKKLMHQYLKDVEKFVKTYGKNIGGNNSAAVFSSGITSGNQAHVYGAVFMLSAMQNDFTKFEDKLFCGAEADARSNTKIVEYKSWAAGISDESEEDDEQKYDRTKSSFWNFERGYQGYGQFLCYLQAINSFEELEYIFDGEKASYKDAVDAFQGLYRNKSEEIFDVIWGNEVLQNSIYPRNEFPNSLPKSIAFQLFNTWIQDKNSKLYNHIELR
ncbi:MAG: hypothetical protein KDC49_14075 [Saprospiraceae bacterium]|nr:hypothetical protein [Saprospiraceae bacterium]